MWPLIQPFSLTCNPLFSKLLVSIGDRADSREVWIDGLRFQEERALRKFTVTLEAKETARKSQRNFLTTLHLRLKIRG